MSSDTTSMSVLEHIAELRRTLLWALGFAVGGAVGAWFLSDQIIETLFEPARRAGESSLYFHAPMEAFLLKLKASAAVGFLLVFPLILYKIYSFVLPGLMSREKRVVTPMLFAATALFYVGVAFCFFVLMPLVIRFAVGFQTESLQPLLSAGFYFDFAARLCLAFGLLFELPMVVFALSWVGVVKPRTLLRGWRYALVAILLVAAVLTPPDPLSQVMLAGPVMLLYIGSVLVAMFVRRGKDKRAREDEDADDESPDEPDDPDSGGGDDSPGPGGGTAPPGDRTAPPGERTEASGREGAPGDAAGPGPSWRPRAADGAIPRQGGAQGPQEAE